MTRNQRPAMPRAARRSRVLTLTTAAAAALLLAACGGGSPTATPATTGTASPSPAMSPSPIPSQSPSPSPMPSPVPSPSPSTTPTPSPSPSPAIGACAAAQLAARVLDWQGAAGHRIADVQLTVTGPTCKLAALARPQLVDGNGAVLIDGAAPGSTTTLTVMTGDVLTTMVQTGDYCQAATPVPPVTVAFVLAGSAGRVVASPLSPTDTGGVPPCMSGPGSTGDIEMHPWAP